LEDLIDDEEVHEEEEKEDYSWIHDDFQEMAENVYAHRKSNGK
jgi:hypothetical protein